MGAKSNIEWTDATWNPVTGCTKISPGCKNCYAENWANRHLGEFSKDHSRKFTDIRTHEDKLAIPLHWRKPRKIFVNSMSDLFHEDVPFEFAAAVFGVMMATREHTYQVLTKRAERMVEFFNWLGKSGIDQRAMLEQYALDHLDDTGICHLQAHLAKWPLSNVWLGVSVENQKAANERIPHLLKTPAAIRFLSCEPLLGPIEFSDVTKRSDAVMQLGKKSLDGIHWVIGGGESGPKARPVHPQWAYSLRDQCVSSGVKFFWKQWGEWLPLSEQDHADPTQKQKFIWPDGREYDGKECITPNCAQVSRVGKKEAGRLIAGVEWNQMPEVQ